MLRTINQLLTNNPNLAKTIAKTGNLAKLKALFQSIVDVPLAQHCFLAKIENQEMIVICESPTWATKFRYAIPDLLKNLNTQPEFKKITSIRYRVMRQKHLAQEPPQRAKKTVVPLSKKTTALLKKTAKQVKNKKLQESLVKLAQHTAISAQEK